MFLAMALIVAPAMLGQTRGCQLPPSFPCPDARIMEFRADVLSIKPGQSAVLSWAAENPGRMTISPGVGAATARGSARVSPAATTTYTLSVAGGPNGDVLTRSVTISVEGTPGAANATPIRSSDIPLRLPDGKPNLQGVYNSFGPRQPAANPQPGALPTRPTLKPGMESYRAVLDPAKVVSDCVVGSVPPSIGPYSFQIIQNSDYVVIHYEYMHLFRTIPLDGSPHQPGISWMGDSIGSWDGDVLVVDTVGFNTESTVGGGGDRHQPFRHSEDLHMVERIRRVDLNTLEIETTLDDTKVFERPWRTVSRYTYHPEYKKVDEYMCNENLKTYDYLIDASKEIKPK
jgi:hypothetical protein